MAGSFSIKIVHYDKEHVANPYPLGDLPWQLYHTVRNAIFHACQQHGPTGGMGECPIRYDEEIVDPYGIEGWHVGDDPCDYYIVEDQYNHERYLYMEIYVTDRLSLAWLADVVAALRDFPGWGIGIKNIEGGYMLIFADKVMVSGPMFRRCKSIETVLRAARRNLGGTPEWEEKRTAKERWRRALDLRSPWPCAAIGTTVAVLLGLFFGWIGSAPLAGVIAVPVGASVGIALWAFVHRKTTRRRIFGEWYCEIDGKERCLALSEDGAANVTAHDHVTGMDHSVDWSARPPTLTLSYLCFSSQDESHQPLESFDVHWTGKSVSTWTTTYAFRFLSENELQLAPPGTDFEIPKATQHPIYRRRVTSSV